jgi:hypothetical protein
MPNTSGDVSTRRSSATEKRPEPLRGVGEPSDVILRLILMASDVGVDERDPEDEL